MDAIQSAVEYREVPGYPGYRVGDDGSVWSQWRTCNKGRFLTGVWRRMKTPANKKGYLYLNLFGSDRKAKTFRVHQLVLRVFVRQPEEGEEGRHLNGIKSDCSLANLAWGTQEQNRQDNHDLGAYGKGSKHTQAKLTEEDVLEIRRRHTSGETMRSLGAAFGVSEINVHYIVRRKSWKHI